MRSNTVPADTAFAVILDPLTARPMMSPVNSTVSDDPVDPDTSTDLIVNRTGASAWTVASLASGSPGTTSDLNSISSRSRNNDCLTVP